jgi:hypothetical protein
VAAVDLTALGSVSLVVLNFFYSQRLFCSRFGIARAFC